MGLALFLRQTADGVNVARLPEHPKHPDSRKKYDDSGAARSRSSNVFRRETEEPRGYDRK
jgi:hypothetical protein